MLDRSPQSVTAGGQPVALQGNRAVIDVPAGRRVDVQITWPAEPPAEQETRFHLFFGFDKPEPGEENTYINGTAPGRQSDDQITLFDGTGVGLQDLAVAASVVDLARAAGTAIDVDF